MIFLTMLAMGILLGFIGAGGSGFIIALLTKLFDIPIHVALGTSISAMVFTALIGTYSHFREGNVVLKLGALVGLFGAVGAYAGTFVARCIDSENLVWLVAGMLLLSSFIMWIQTRVSANHQQNAAKEPTKSETWVSSSLTGLITGGLSGSFGIGSTPFIQIAFIKIFKMPLPLVAGTTMAVILPIAFFGSVGYYNAGYLQWDLLTVVVTGTMLGAYIGAKFTRHAPTALLRIVMICVPLAGGLLLLS